MRRAATVLLVALATLAWFATLGYRDLIHPDEGRYAEIGRQMLASGDWVTPRLNGILYFEKPALQYWATAAAFAVLGHGEFAARLWPGLTGAFAVFALWWAGRRVLGDRAAWLSACVLGSCVWWLGNGHFVNLDTALSAFLTLTLLGFWVAQRDQANERERRLGMLAAWAGMGLAVLSKGLIGIVLPGAVLVVYSLVSRDFQVWARMRWLPGLAVFAALVVPWFVLVSARNPDFARFFFIHEHFERFLTTSHRRTGPLWYFVPLLLAGLIPWTTLLPGALAAGWRRTTGRFQPNRLLVVWAVVIFGFFSVSGSKLPSYILPVFPALALLIGGHLHRLPARRLAWHAGVMVAALLLALLGLLAFTLGWLPSGSVFSPEDLAYRNWIAAGLTVLVLLIALAVALARGGRAGAAVVAITFGGLIGTQLILQGHQTLSAEKSAKAMARAIGAALPAGAPVFSVSYYDQTLPFYLGRPVTLVNWVDEFETGLRIEPQHALPTEQAFGAIWRDLAGGAAVMRPETYLRWQSAGLPMTVVYQDPSRVAVLRAAK